MKVYPCFLHGDEEFESEAEYAKHLEENGIPVSGQGEPTTRKRVIHGPSEVTKIVDNDILSAQKPPVFTVPPVDAKRPSEAPTMPLEGPKEEKPKKEPLPIVLEYKFKGDCKECGKPVHTFVTQVKEQWVAFAHCPDCMIQYEALEVFPLPEKKDKVREKVVK